MKYLLIFIAFIVAIQAKAQGDFQTTPKGALYHIYTPNAGPKLKLNDVITFNFIEKTDKDSVLRSTYQMGSPVQAQIQPSQNIADLMEILPLLTVGDSSIIKIPTDTLFKGHDNVRPAFFPKGSNLIMVIKILKEQTLQEAMAERDAQIAKIKALESADAAKYIADHKWVVNTTASGLKYFITKASTKPKPLKGDTLLVNYAGRTTDDKFFDTSLPDVAKSAGIFNEARPYEPLQVNVGMGKVIPGWDEGLLLLNEGSKATFIIPSDLGYGSQGMGDGIKPFSTLIFDVELVKIKPIKHAATAVVAKPVVKTPVKKKIVKKN